MITMDVTQFESNPTPVMRAVADGDIAHLKNGREGYWEIKFMHASQSLQESDVFQAIRSELESEGYRFPVMDLSATDRETIYD